MLYVLNHITITRLLFSVMAYGSWFFSLFLSLSRSQSLRGLFERDKIVFSFMLCAQIMRGERKISDVEWNFFLRGSSSMDREYPNKPDAPWLSDRLLSFDVSLFRRPCLRPTRSDGFLFILKKIRVWICLSGTGALPATWWPRLEGVSRILGRNIILYPFGLHWGIHRYRNHLCQNF